MTEREQLLEILRKPIFPHELVDPLEAVADYLLDNGVTLQRWIPVTDRLPENDYLILCYGGGFCMCSFFKGKFNDFDENGYPYEVTGITHWMPLPTPPKEENIHDQRR